MGEVAVVIRVAIVQKGLSTRHFLILKFNFLIQRRPQTHMP